MFTWTIHMNLQRGYMRMQDTDKKTLIQRLSRAASWKSSVWYLRRSLEYDFAATQQSDAACLLNCYTLSGPDLDLPFDSQTFKDFLHCRARHQVVTSWWMFYTTTLNISRCLRCLSSTWFIASITGCWDSSGTQLLVWQLPLITRPSLFL